jgi:D-mannonate dehydratase
MDNITIGQIAGAIGTLTVIVGFFVAISKWYKTNITDKLNKLEQRLTFAEMQIKENLKETEKSKLERMILLRGELACLKGLYATTKNDEIANSIKEIEEYMMLKSHD